MSLIVDISVDKEAQNGESKTNTHTMSDKETKVSFIENVPFPSCLVWEIAIFVSSRNIMFVFRRYVSLCPPFSFLFLLEKLYKVSCCKTKKP